MTTLRLYNTLTRRKEEFRPIDPSNVRMYVCGPTVYDFAHIGNARPVIVFDVLFRLLRHLYGEKHVTYVRNVTDVDDKINARAARDFPGLALNEAIRRVTETTYGQFHADVAALGALEPTHEPRATDHIAGMVAIIDKLLAKDHAYVATGPEGQEVLFSVGSMPDYGALSKRRLEDQVAGARVAVEAHKRNPADFVLWKESAADEPGWPGAFAGGVTIHGRPGWHIECSAMSEAFLGETFDIHGGGLDLIFPHHENEIAQSRCAHGTPVMANYWMHNGFLQVEGEKMSKSLGNFVTIQDLLETEKFGGKFWEGYVLRLAMLSAHYRQPIDWTERRLQEFTITSDDFRVRLLHVMEKFDTDLSDTRPEEVDSRFLDYLMDDLNTSSAITRLRAIASDVGESPNLSTGRMLAASLKLLGFKIPDRAAWDEPDEDFSETARVFELITARNAARASKNWAESDRIRDELATMGIQLKDGKDAAGQPVTTWEVKR